MVHLLYTLEESLKMPMLKVKGKNDIHTKLYTLYVYIYIANLYWTYLRVSHSLCSLCQLHSYHEARNYDLTFSMCLCIIAYPQVSVSLLERLFTICHMLFLSVYLQQNSGSEGKGAWSIINRAEDPGHKKIQGSSWDLMNQPFYLLKVIDFMLV